MELQLGKATRDAFGTALAKLGGQQSDIVVLDGDVHNSTRTEFFAEKYPARFFNLGIALMKQGRHDEADLEHREAVRIDPQREVPRHTNSTSRRPVFANDSA